MSKPFRPWKIDEPLLLPPTVQDFVGADHVARFVLSLVREAVDLARITGTYGSERGQPPFDPIMMTALLLYSYCCGHLLLARDRQGVPGTGGFHEHCGARRAGFPHHFGFPQAALEGAGPTVQAGLASVREGRPGGARACGARWYQDQSQRIEAQGDELRPH